MSVTIVMNDEIGPAIAAFETESEVHIAMERMNEAQQTAVLLLMDAMPGTHVTGTVTLGEGENFGSVKVELTGYNVEES